MAVLALREATRRRAFFVWVLALLLSAFLAPRLGGMASLSERLRLGLEYGMGIPVFLLGAATLVVATGSLGHDVERRQMQLVATKPLSSWTLLSGKLLGVTLLNAVLLAGIVAAFLGGIATVSARAVPEAERTETRHRFYTMRREVAALPAGTQAVLLAPGEELRLELTGLPRGLPAGERILVRFRFHALPALSAVHLDLHWTASGTTPIETRAQVASGADGVVELPAEAAGSGAVSLSVRNALPDDSGAHVAVPPASVRVLVPSGSFAGSLALALASVLCQLVLLAAAGTFAAAAFSLPTASLFAFAFYFATLAASYVRESLEFLLRVEPPHPGALDRLAELLAPLTRAVLRVVPDFSGRDPLAPLLDGRTVTFRDFSSELGLPFLLQAAVLFVLAVWVWSRREAGSTLA